jgi:Fe-S cluster assembly scaffold protein SufB
VAVDTDKYTAAAALGFQNGCVIRSCPGSKNILPVQACLYAGTQGLRQHAHNIIIAGEDSELHVIAGCSAAPGVTEGLYAGVTEFFVGKNAVLSFTMVYDRAPDMVVRTRSAARIEQGGRFFENSICLKPVRSLQTYLTADLVGNCAAAGVCTLTVGNPGSECDVGGSIRLKAPGTRARITAKNVTNGGKVVSRAHMSGEAPGARGLFECRGLTLKDGALHTIPELEVNACGAEIGHQSSIGKISRDEVNYLMSRGMSEDDATSIILRGFMSVDDSGMPFQLQTGIDRIIELGLKEALHRS